MSSNKSNQLAQTSANKSKEAHEKIHHLESRNNFLEEKVKVLKHQILSYSTPENNRHHHTMPLASAARQRPASAITTPARRPTFIDPSPASPGNLRGKSEARQRHSERRISRMSPGENHGFSRERGGPAVMPPGMSEKAVQLLQEAKNENLQLHREVEDLKLQMVNRDAEFEEIREQIQKRELEHDEEVFTLRKELLEGKKEELESGVRTNVQVLKLQAEVGSRDQVIASLRTQMRTLTETAANMKRANTGLIAQMEDLNEQLRTEQNRSLQLQEKIRGLPSLERDLSEARSSTKALTDENKSLREANDQLVNAAFEREAEMQRREKSLAEKISHTERLVNSENSDLRLNLDQASRAKACLEADIDQLERRVRNAEDLTRQTEDRLRRKEQELIFEQRDKKMVEQRLQQEQQWKMSHHQSPVKKNVTHSSTNTSEELIKCKNCASPKKQPSLITDVVPQRVDSLTKRELADLQLQFLKVNAELEKTRSLLIVQHKMNEGFDSEINIYKRRITELENADQVEKTRTKTTLFVKDKKITELEHQIRSMYLSASTPPETLIDQLVVLRRQSVLCFHLSRLELLNTFPELHQRGNDESSTTWILAVSVMNKWFFRVELDRVGKNFSPAGNSFELSTTAFYRVAFDDGLKEKLESERTIRLEIRELTAGSTKSKLLAECDLSLKDLVKYPENRLHGTATLCQAVTARPGSAMSVNRNINSRRLYDIEVSHCHFWVRLISDNNRKVLLEEDSARGGVRPVPVARGRSQQFKQQLQNSSVESSMDDDEDDVVSVRRAVIAKPVKPPRSRVGQAVTSGGNGHGSDATIDGRDQQRKASDQSLASSSALDSEQEDQRFPENLPRDEDTNQQPETSDGNHYLTFTIHHLQLSPNTVVTSTNRPNDKVFVEFEFPYVDQEELQTPEAQPITTHTPLIYNFEKRVNITDNQRDVLKTGLTSNKALVRFTVVLEPADENLECEDVGVALADLGACLRGGGDLKGLDVPVVSADNPAEIIGSLNISLLGYGTLKAIVED